MKTAVPTIAVCLTLGCSSAVQVQHVPAKSSNRAGTTSVRSTIPETRLQRLRPGGWETVCKAPCDPVVDPGDYRLVAPKDLEPTRIRVASAGLDSIELEGEPGRQRAGAIMLGLAAAGTAASFVLGVRGAAAGFCLFCSADAQREADRAADRNFRAAGLVGLGSALALGIGAYVIATGAPTLRIARRAGSAPERIRISESLELSPTGLHF